VTKFFHWLLPRNSADCSISFGVDLLTSTASLTLSIHRFLGLPLGFHSSHLRAVLLVDILLTCPYHLNCASSVLSKLQNALHLYFCSDILASQSVSPCDAFGESQHLHFCCLHFAFSCHCQCPCLASVRYKSKYRRVYRPINTLTARGSHVCLLAVGTRAPHLCCTCWFCRCQLFSWWLHCHIDNTEVLELLYLLQLHCLNTLLPPKKTIDYVLRNSDNTVCFTTVQPQCF